MVSSHGIRRMLDSPTRDASGQRVHVIPKWARAVIQIFERGALVWDTARVYDNPVGVGSDSIYFAHINSGEVLKFILGCSSPAAPAAQC